MFLCQLAGLTIRVENRYPFVEHLCRQYPAPAGAVPAFTVCAGEDSLKSRGTAAALPPDRRESAEIYRAICTRMPDFDGLVLHASAVSVDGRAFLFVAPSGAGKSTHARLWCEQFGPRAVTLNDDKPLLRQQGGTWRVYGTPWSGPHGVNANASAPLHALCLLRRGTAAAVRPLTGAQALPGLLGETLRPADPKRLGRLCRLLDDLLRACPAFDLACTRDPADIPAIYDALS